MSRVVHIGNATLYLGDCRDILPTLPKVDAVITDPPYGIGFAAQPTMYQREHGHMASDWDNRTPDDAIFPAILSMCRVAAIWGGNYFPLPKSRGWLAWVKPDSAPSMADLELAWTSVDQNSRAFRKSVKSAALEKDMVHGFHPTQKPVALMEWTMQQVGVRSMTLDPFMGSGTTGVACMELQRPFVGIEIDPSHFAKSCERIENAQRQLRMFS